METPSNPGHFDLLPILLRDKQGQRSYFELPDNLVKQIHIEHPTEPSIGSLGIQRYTLPCVSSMILTIGGIDYPCSPFNGFYMSTEIASRNLSDERRLTYCLLLRGALVTHHPSPQNCGKTEH